MKMIETIESDITRTSQELWADICSCLPSPEQQEVPNELFADSFIASCRETHSGLKTAQPSETAAAEVEDWLKPWAPLNDSEVYLASLERRLRRIKGLSQEITSKDMLRTLAQAKKEHWDRLLMETFQSEVFVDDHECDESTLEHLKRWLQPDKVAVSVEEVQCLIPPKSSTEQQEHAEESPTIDQ
ncbi:coiled-coil domain-containing protein 32 [Ambystoma mexicanum]|uniref:coiled-coil domain-containing protein 32 n=1 Tax=Ambystoma mexicanum TaxID=8296 RepID=UPI0037E83D04